MIVYGTFGIGKSISGKEKIIIIEKNEAKVIPIKDFVYNPKINQQTISLDNSFKPKLQKIINAQKFNHKGKLIEIKTRSGRKVTATPCHSFIIIDKNLELKEVRGSDLKKGDIIPTSLSEVPILHKSFSSKVINKRGKETNLKLKADFDLGFVIGVYLAEGSLDNKGNSITFSTQQTKLREQLVKSLNKINFKPRKCQKYIGVCNQNLKEFLLKNSGKLAGNKFINPDFYFTPQEFRKGLLSG